MANEALHGLVALHPETVASTQRFTAGQGRHGSFG